MPKATLAEALLARITGPTRAAAILGDLLELSATRGRLWFWTALRSHAPLPRLAHRTRGISPRLRQHDVYL